MAHQYNNFDDAYTAYESWWNWAKTFWGYADNSVGRILAHYNAGEVLPAIYDIIVCLGQIQSQFNWLTGHGSYSFDYVPLNESIYWAGRPANGDGVTMRELLDAMFTADDEELMQFIALVDAYRQSLWNKPFDINYWAAVAKGFEQWEF